MKVGALFVFVGGAVGGAAVGLVMFAIAVVSNIQAFSADLAVITQLLRMVLFTSVWGIVLGFPAALATGATYIAVAEMRKLWRITAFGAGASALWGALFIGSGSLPRDAWESSLTMAAFFAGAGLVASFVCCLLLTRLRLQPPV